MNLSKFLSKSSRKSKQSSEDSDQNRPSKSTPSSPKTRSSPPHSPDKRERHRDRDRDRPSNQAQESSPNSPSSNSHRSRHSNRQNRTPIESNEPRDLAERQRKTPSPTKYSPPKQSPTKQSSRPSSLRNPLSWQSHRGPERFNHIPAPDFQRHSTLPNMATNDPDHGDPMDISSPPSMNGFSSSSHGPTDEDYPPAPPLHRVPTGPPAVDAEACKAAGNKFFKNQQYDKAIEEYSKAIDADPNSSTYYSNRAAAYMSANLFYEALEDIKRADELEPNNPKIIHRLARVYTSIGRPKEAIEVYESLRPPASAKDMAPAINMLQHISQAEAQLKEGTSGSMTLHALDMAARGLGKGIDQPRKWKLLRGEAYLKMGNPNSLGEALGVAVNLLRINNQDPEALVLRGRVLYAQGDNDKAIVQFKSALNCDPDFREAVKYLRMVQKLDKLKKEGNDHFTSNRPQEAVKYYTEALDIDPNNRPTNAKLYLNRALCYLKLQQSKSALSDCERALDLDPSYIKARKTKAKALSEQGDWEAALREYKSVQESNPSEPGIHREIRTAELELKKSKRKDYYKILGLGRDATEADIKRAYRRLAIVHHPDKNPDDETAAERFKDINEAHETLSDPQKRARYDSGEDLIDPSDMFGGGGFGGMGGGGVQIDPQMLFNMMGQMGGGGGHGPGGGFSFSGGSPFGGGAPHGFGGGAGGNPFGGGQFGGSPFGGAGGNPFGGPGGNPFGGAAGGSGSSRRGQGFPPGAYPFG